MPQLKMFYQRFFHGKSAANDDMIVNKSGYRSDPLLQIGYRDRTTSVLVDELYSVDGCVLCCLFLLIMTIVSAAIQNKSMRLSRGFYKRTSSSL